VATAHNDIVGEVWRLTIAAKFSNDQWQLPSIYLEVISTAGGDTKALVCGQMDSLMSAHVVPTLATSTFYYGSRMSPAHTTPPWLPYKTVVSMVGTGTGSELPTQVRPLVSFGTEKSGRAWRGRIYGFTPSAQWCDSDGSPTAGLSAAWLNSLDPWRATLSVGGTLWGMCLVHRQGPPPAPLLPVDPITTLVFQDRFATQRRSGSFGRPNSEPWI
jgi:hypothetical protein